MGPHVSKGHPACQASAPCQGCGGQHSRCVKVVQAFEEPAILCWHCFAPFAYGIDEDPARGVFASDIREIHFSFDLLEDLREKGLLDKVAPCGVRRDMEACYQEYDTKTGSIRESPKAGRGPRAQPPPLWANTGGSVFAGMPSLSPSLCSAPERDGLLSPNAPEHLSYAAAPTPPVTSAACPDAGSNEDRGKNMRCCFDDGPFSVDRAGLDAFGGGCGSIFTSLSLSEPLPSSCAANSGANSASHGSPPVPRLPAGVPAGCGDCDIGPLRHLEVQEEDSDFDRAVSGAGLCSAFDSAFASEGDAAECEDIGLRRPYAGSDERCFSSFVFAEQSLVQT